ncbi:MAG: dTDP-glucose 4,6-dehydratase [Anaerolineales bacterium]|nr:dTDP-glucose 4,6-dehydratase [Anaerolineales bacterium]
MKNILVTGGAGFIGSNFIHFLLQTEPGIQVVNLDSLTYAGSPENLNDLPDPSRHQLIQGDICDRPLVDRLLHHYQIGTIVHFAAETHVDRSIVNPEPFIRTNVLGTFTLLEAARQYWINEQSLDLAGCRFHHISTDEVFGSLGRDEPAWTEATPYAPNSPYAASKAASDHLVRSYGHTFGMPVSITNCSNNYGPRQFPEKLIPLMIANATHGRPLPIYGDGQQIRDWLYVEDHCDAIWSVITKGRPGETYNIGGGNQPANLLVVQTLCEIMDECQPDSPYAPHQSLIRFVTDRPGHDRRYAMDSTKIQADLGWQPRHSLATGLLKTAEWYLGHPEWLQAIQQQENYQVWLARNYDQRTSAS